MQDNYYEDSETVDPSYNYDQDTAAGIIYPWQQVAKTVVKSPTSSVSAESGAWRRMELIQMMIPLAASAGATSVENIINTASKLERYILTGINPLEQPIIDHGPEDGPITSDVFEADLGEQFIVDENDTLQPNPEYIPF